MKEWRIADGHGQVLGSVMAATGKAAVAKATREGMRGSGGSRPRFAIEKGAYRDTYKPKNASRRLTKAQRRVNASKRSAKRRIAKALQKFLKSQNPAANYAGARIRRNKGSITIIPIKLRRASR
jgi:hypothetical protein